MTEVLMTQLGHNFRNPQLLETALTHRSYFFENRAQAAGHFERFEFLGDAVLDLILSETLMTAHPQADEGALSKWRASLVNENALAEVARQFELGQFLHLGKSESAQRPQLRPRLLASALEAVIAALYLDGGLEIVRAFVLKHFASRIDSLDKQNEFSADFKTRLQELSQKRFRTVPAYKLISDEGPDHAKIFTVEVYVNGRRLGEGSGSSRKEAEQAAAGEALKTEEKRT